MKEINNNIYSKDKFPEYETRVKVEVVDREYDDYNFDIYSSKKHCQIMTTCFSKRFIDFVTSVSAFVKSPKLLRL